MMIRRCCSCASGGAGRPVPRATRANANGGTSHNSAQSPSVYATHVIREGTVLSNPPLSHSLSSPGPRARARLSDVDRAKGFAILLVVAGHLVARETPEGAAWYDSLRIGIYLFHMPFFMYLSGYVTFLSGAARTPPDRWRGLVHRRAARLLLPFAAFGLLILCGKLIASRFAPVDNVPPGFWSGLRDLVWTTQHSPATSVWYIAVLFIYCVATPVALWADRSGKLLLGAAALLYLLPLPPWLYLDRAGTFLVFFVLGGLAADAGPAWRRFASASWPPALAALLAALLVVGGGYVVFDWSDGWIGFPYKWALLAAGLLSIPALHGAFIASAAWPLAPFAALGRYVFVIYLLNTPFIGAAKAVALRFVPWDGAHFPVLAAVLMLAGTAGPLLTKILVLRRIPAVDRMTD